MTTGPDVVAELDAWLDHVDVARVMGKDIAQRARDEIVALRRTIRLSEDGTLIERAAIEARAEALEEAARIADGYCTDRTDDVAAAIRALKDKIEEAHDENSPST